MLLNNSWSPISETGMEVWFRAAWINQCQCAIDKQHQLR